MFLQLFLLALPGDRRFRDPRLPGWPGDGAAAKVLDRVWILEEGKSKNKLLDANSLRKKSLLHSSATKTTSESPRLRRTTTWRRRGRRRRGLTTRGTGGGAKATRWYRNWGINGRLGTLFFHYLYAGRERYGQEVWQLSGSQGTKLHRQARYLFWQKITTKPVTGEALHSSSCHR